MLNRVTVSIKPIKEDGDLIGPNQTPRNLDRSHVSTFGRLLSKKNERHK